MIEASTHDDVTVLRLAHGKASALDLELLQALRAELRACHETGAIVLTGTDRIFCASVDLVRLQSADTDYIESFLAELVATFDELFTHPRPTICALNGHSQATQEAIAHYVARVLNK